MNRVGESPSKFTPKQGQYLAFIDAYTLLNRRPPAQADIQSFFRVTPPTVYQMLFTLEKAGLISPQTRRGAKHHRSRAAKLDFLTTATVTC